MKIFDNNRRNYFETVEVSNFSHLMKKVFFLLLMLFNFEFLGQKNLLSAQQTEITTITIKNARQTSYKKSEETGNDLIVLDGSVELSVQKGETTSEISADNITYDRKTEMLYAQGNVQITTKSSSSGGETTYASSLLLNTSTLEGIFDGGKVVQTQSDALNLPSGSTMIVFSDLFGKGSQNTIAFKNSSLTFCDDENPHWKIDATRTFLLPGGEFAFFNALLYVGPIPVLYLPAFYYPKDELIFNPVFSTRKREGYAIQTTTYIWGRKPLASSSSTSSSSSSSSSSDSTTSTSSEALKGLYNFVRPSTLKEQKLEGLILHNLDEDYKGDSSQYIKILADWYTNLGGLVGFDINLNPKNDYISKFGLSLDMGFSRTIIKNNGEYYPYYGEDGKYIWDKSSFLGLKNTPFRYSGKLEFNLSKPFTLSLSLPVYSDPFYNFDFKTYRSENMDWISYLLESTKNQDDDISISEVSSFTWQMNSSYSPKLPDLLKPYISSVSMSAKSSVNFSVKNTVFSSNEKTKEWIDNTPERKFYYPSTVNVANVSINMNGTLFSWPITDKTKSFPKINYLFTLNKPEELKSDSQLQKEKQELENRKKEENDSESKEDEKKDNENTQTEKKEPEKSIKDFLFYLPNIQTPALSQSTLDGIKYKLSYSINPSFNYQISYASENLNSSEDFDWKKHKSQLINFKSPVNVKSDFSFGGSFLSVSNVISYSPVIQTHPYINENTSEGGYSQSSKNSLILADKKASSQDITNSNSISIKPFINFDIFSDSSISWNSTIKLLRTEYSYDKDTNTGEYKYSALDWDDEKSVTVNSLTAVVSAKEFDKKFGQSLKITAIMPPLLKQYDLSLGLTFPYVNFSVSSGLQEKTKDTSVAERWKIKSLTDSLTISFPLLSKTLSFSNSFSYNMEEKYTDSLKLSLSWYGFSVSALFSYTTMYDLTDFGWEPNGKEFYPYNLSFSYTTPSKTFYRWFNRISIAPSLSTSLVIDWIRGTYSYFIFSPAITIKFNKVLDLTFSSTSRNSVIYWYVNKGKKDEWSDFPGGNILKDLIDSFRFDDRSYREQSGFKLKSLNMTLSHDLHDWKLNMTLKIEPRVIKDTETKRNKYDFHPYFTIGVVWSPMESIKTTVTDKYGEWKLE